MPLALVVGAGIGGLAAGLALRRAGWDVRIFEGAETPRAIGFALGLAPNAMAALRELGVAETVASLGFTPLSAEVRRVNGRVLRRLGGGVRELPPGDLPKLILRSALHNTLLAAVGLDVVEVNQTAVGAHPDGPRVRLDLASGASATGDIVVGADGVGSVIRAQLHPGEPPARPSGYLAVRGLSPAVDRLNPIQALWYFGRGVESGIVQTSPGAIYWFVSLFAEDVRSGSMEVHDVMRRVTAGWDPLFHVIIGATPPADMRLDELFVREPLGQWGSGRVTLLGDAAHPMLPHTGQGAAQAMEDAVALGRVLRNRGDHVAALRRYEDVRGRRTRRVVNMGPRIARITTTKNAVVGALRDAGIRLVPQMALVKVFTGVGPDPYRELNGRS